MSPIVLIVGSSGGTNVGASLKSAAEHSGLESLFADSSQAFRGPWALRQLNWRMRGHRPPKLNAFSADVVQRCRRSHVGVVIATGMAPLPRSALEALRSIGVTTINYSTDDPWSPVHRAPWFMKALPAYDVIATPRSANLEDFSRIGCQDVRYVPFAFDEFVLGPSPGDPSRRDGVEEGSADVLFIGGADVERAAFFADFARSGLPFTLAGSYWERFPATRAHSLGQVPADTMRTLTRSAKINLCLVRRSNRDGHVMRSFEIAALGGCMLVEDTAEHREIFGEEGECVLYFSSPGQAVEHARRILADEKLRTSLSRAVKTRIWEGGNTYTDRLRAMLETARRS